MDTRTPAPAAPQTNVYVTVPQPQQLPWLVRAVWYLVIGWWLTGIWIWVAYLLALTVIGLPVANAMFASTNAVLTLRRS